MRSNSDEGMQRLRRRFELLVASTAAAHGCTADIDWMEHVFPYYPPTVNDPHAYRFAMDVADRLSAGSGGMASVGPTEATMAGEDFSFIARAVPSCFIFLGTRNETMGAGALTAQHAAGVGKGLLSALLGGANQPPQHTHLLPLQLLRLGVQCMACTRRASRWTRACSSWAPRCTPHWRRSTWSSGTRGRLGRQGGTKNFEAAGPVPSCKCTCQAP